MNGGTLPRLWHFSRRQNDKKQGKICENPRTAGRKALSKCIFSGKEKQRHTAATPPPQPDISRRYQRFPPPRRGYVPDKGKSAAYLEQVSTTVPKFAYRAFCPCGKLVGECLPQTLLSSSRTSYHSFPRRRENSFIASLVLSPQSRPALRGTP